MRIIGEREWVQRGYDWAAALLTRQLRGHGAERLLRKRCRQQYFDQHGRGIERGAEQQYLREIGINLQRDVAKGPIKLLDIGSCYNPFAKYSGFDVTALGLCSGDPSVLKVRAYIVQSYLAMCRNWPEAIKTMSPLIPLRSSANLRFSCLIHLPMISYIISRLTFCE